jgi:hypothetical protein
MTRRSPPILKAWAKRVSGERLEAKKNPRKIPASPAKTKIIEVRYKCLDELYFRTGTKVH